MRLDPSPLLRAGSCSLRGRRVDLVNPAQAVGFSVMRARNEGAAHLGTVPAGYHTEPERLFEADETRRKILHEHAFNWRSILSRRGGFLRVLRKSNSGRIARLTHEQPIDGLDPEGWKVTVSRRERALIRCCLTSTALRRHLYGASIHPALNQSH
jgi:hypothetical protein